MDNKYEDALKKIRNTISRFEKIEGKPWGAEGAVIELAKQVGDLSALIMNKEGYYFSDRDKLSDKYDSSNNKIGDELIDIIFAVVRIADHYNIDLIAANDMARAEDEKFFITKGI